VYPTWSQPPRLIAEPSRNGDGDNSQQFSPTSGFPAINVPMGYTRGGTLPAGVTFFGRAWDEAGLTAFGYDRPERRRGPQRAPIGKAGRFSSSRRSSALSRTCSPGRLGNGLPCADVHHHSPAYRR
jgi:hypothetical protein